MAQLAAFATDVLPDLYAFHRYTGIPPASTMLKPDSLEGSPAVEPLTFTPDLSGRLRALYAQ